MPGFGCKPQAASGRGHGGGGEGKEGLGPRLELDKVGNDRSIGIQRGLIDARERRCFPNMIGWDGTYPRHLPALS